MRLATWNVNGLRARLDFVFHWLSSRQPDVVGLQELKVSEDQFPYSKFEAEGYHTVVHAQKAWNGVAILSRECPKIEQKGLPGQEDFGARLVSASIGSLSFATVYCPNGKQVGHADFFRKLHWFESLADYLRQKCLAEDPIILCGDFNICPTVLDTWNEEELFGRIFHTEEERRCFNRLVEWGLVDVFRKIHPQSREFSWWDYRAGSFHRNLGLRIDLFLATRSVMERVQHVEIDREYRKKKEGLTASDHAPVLVDLR